MTAPAGREPLSVKEELAAVRARVMWLELDVKDLRVELARLRADLEEAKLRELETEGCEPVTEKLADLTLRVRSVKLQANDQRVLIACLRAELVAHEAKFKELGGRDGA